ncbi:F-box/kelch-repeat protein At3g27150-like [Arachis duranensis]|uniref:F-box/kelch-repeat protein At3g27150-like n=1 Tax=Arachis duranensis TaxID=130453 RepID=A0A6P4CA80_ARADU|nr:F-box/kelch-repeat protein At3g27150-like [Arachis duranensis]
MSNRKAFPAWSFIGDICLCRHNPSSEKMRILELSHSSGNGSTSSSDEKSQDADYFDYKIPCLSDELETLILARLPITEHWKFCCMNKQFLSFLKTGEVFRIRREIGLKEPVVFIASDESNWWSFNSSFTSFKKIPVIPSDYSFDFGDKESFAAGTNLFVSGKEIDGTVVWGFELATNKWFKAPKMINPRCLFASATKGIFAYIAGGLETTTCQEVLSSAEKYNSESRSWERLPEMKQKRKFCSGCYMDNRFYVLGGRDEYDNDLVSGEFFDQGKNTWILIPGMLKDIPLPSSRSPPLVAVANNELYTLDASSNELKVYVKESNSWKTLGPVPVRADTRGGWGVAFKSLGNELLVIGGATASSSSSGCAFTIYTCCPDPRIEKLKWTRIVCGSTNLNPFIRNCAVMLA